MKIYCVCGMGLGSSLIAKMNVESILKQEGIDAKVDNCDIGVVTSVQADIYVTTAEMAKSMPEDIRAKTVILNDFINMESIRNNLMSHIHGLVSK